MWHSLIYHWRDVNTISWLAWARYWCGSTDKMRLLSSEHRIMIYQSRKLSPIDQRPIKWNGNEFIKDPGHSWTRRFAAFLGYLNILKACGSFEVQSRLAQRVGDIYGQTSGCLRISRMDYWSWMAFQKRRTYFFRIAAYKGPNAQNIPTERKLMWMRW